MSADSERLADLYDELESASHELHDVILYPHSSAIDILQAQAVVDVIGEDILALGGELP